MTTTISSTEDTFQPVVVDGFSSRRETRNVIHGILGSSTPAVTLRDAGPRTGTLTALFATLDTARALEAALAGSSVLTFADTDYPDLGFSFIGNGDVSVELDDDTRTAWIVAFDYQEVPT